MRNFWYVPLESLKARYTSQLGEKWMPKTFDDMAGLDWKWQAVVPPNVSEEITTGSVLDGVNRGVVCMSQVRELLIRINEIKSEDVIFLQDFWTPGIEALFYALHLRNVTPWIYAMCHAQSVDEYDFTYPMRPWMRHFELGIAEHLSGMFVASTIHREQLKAAGFNCPIHVVGLPIDSEEIQDRIIPLKTRKENMVVFSSRLNNEKNPYFMLDVARTFLSTHQDWTWEVTTSAAEFKSEIPGLLNSLQAYASAQPRFKLRARLTKDSYYETLRRARIQFNSSLQDYVSWTLLEAAIAGCEPVYPNYRSFPECLPDFRLYTPFSLYHALERLNQAAGDGGTGFNTFRPVEVCDLGRRVEMGIMLKNWDGPEVNVWHQPQSYFNAVGLLGEDL